MTPEQKVYDALELAPGDWTLDELARWVRLSKSAVRRALINMHESGSIALTTTEEDQG